MIENCLVVHVIGGGFCSGSAYRTRWPGGIEPKEPEHGVFVDCGVCWKVGVLPDSGYEQAWIRAAFEAHGATVTEQGGAMVATWP